MSSSNPYSSDTPEWQLFENAKSAELAARAFAADAERYAKLSQAAREKAERFAAALEKLSTKSEGK